MYPRQHAVVSVLTASLYAAVTGITPVSILLWAVIGGVAGVFIDVDHLLLTAVVAGNQETALHWFRHPARALLKPRQLVDDIHYGGRAIYVHRIGTHFAVLALLALLVNVHRLFIPAAVGVAAHIIADIVWDLHHGNYTPSDTG
ncbi:MAG: hypothetical protein SVY41_01995 [Candidatus Nanohaloarchaea archaeon]|nr:hypothetical protein [Candidatus Nanohaloarchaea archaeon]